MHIKSKHYIYEETVEDPPTISLLVSLEEKATGRWDYYSKLFYSYVNIIINKYWIILYLQFYSFLFLSAK